MTAQCEISNPPPSSLPGMGVNGSKCSITQLVRSTADGCRARPPCPKRQYLQVMGEGDWQGSLRGRAIQLLAQTLAPNQQDSASRGCQASPSPALTESEKQSQGNTLLLKDPKLFRKKNNKRRVSTRVQPT
jgi:hypothetical protein